jgi:hypothetical protein
MPQATQPVVGPAIYADGSPVNPRACRDGSAGVQDTHARYLEAVLRGRVFTAGTPVAGCAPGTALGTAASFCLYNPLGSGYNAAILKTSMGYLSGTLGAGDIYYCCNGVVGAQGATAVTGTTNVIKNCLIGTAANAACTSWSAATVVTTVAGILRPVGWSQLPMLATTAIPVPMYMDEVAGEFVLTPGNIFVMHMVGGAGSSPLVTWGCTWEELPISSTTGG